MRHLALIACLVALAAGCSDPIQGHIDTIIEGGDDLEQAKLALNMAKGTAVAPVIRAFEDRALPVRARLDMAEALYRLYLREDRPDIFASLVAALADPLPEVRAGAARAIGSLRRRQAVEPLLARFTAETDPRMKVEILTALEFMSMEAGDWNSHVTPHLFSDEQKASFAADLTRTRSTAIPDTLRKAATEWLEVLAEDRATEAQQRFLAADVAGAEALLLAALELVPESKNINQKLGRLYHDTGDWERALEYLDRNGMVARAHRLPAAPVADGRLDDAAWAGVEPLTDFHQCIWRRSALPTAGRSEAYLGYHGDTLYVAVRAYEPNTANLVAASTERDNMVHADDCVEIFLDTNHDFQSYYQLMFNSIGTIGDFWTEEGDWGSWQGEYRVGTAVADTFWVVEVAIPVGQLQGDGYHKGDVWGFNIARVRIGNASEYGQWVPTYGYSRQPDRFGFLLFE
jgi:tetratricopeptide (TPR) repeat protein